MWRASVKKDAADVSAFGEGFVLVGGASRRPEARIWLSTDGATWSKVKDSDVFDRVVLRRVTSFEDGIVALGTQGRRLVSLHSTDGATWSKSVIDKVEKGMELFPQAITDGPTGLIAVASMIAQDFAGQRFYTSEDGRTWQEIEPPSETAPGMFVSLEATDDGVPRGRAAALRAWRRPLLALTGRGLVGDLRRSRGRRAPRPRHRRGRQLRRDRRPGRDLPPGHLARRRAGRVGAGLRVALDEGDRGAPRCGGRRWSRLPCRRQHQRLS